MRVALLVNSPLDTSLTMIKFALVFPIISQSIMQRWPAWHCMLGIALSRDMA